MPIETIPSDAQLESSGAVIGEILIDNQNIFDPQDPREDRKLFRLANRLHIKTRGYVVRDQLLFHAGDPFSRRLLEESARILRSDRYFYDAWIEPVRYHDGQVDVRVTTRDVWTLNPGVSFGRSGGKNTSGFDLEELNILGTGAQVSVAHKTSIDRTSDLVGAGDQHAFGTWTSIFGEYSRNSDGYLRQLSIDHPFYALDVRRAGGLSLFNDEQIDSLYDRGQIVDQFRDHRKYASGYLGLSQGLRDGWVRRWSFGVTSDEHIFDPAPAWTGVIAIPANRKFVYPWVELDLIQDHFLEYRNHDQIQRTEDFYVGTTGSVRVGWADSSFGSSRSALVFSGAAGEGLGDTDHNTVLFAQTFSGRVQDGTLRNGVLDASVRYYARQSSKWLFFSTLDATVGHNLDLDNQMLLGGDNGLRGYPLRYQGGDARALFTVEQRYFTDWYPFRLFRVGGAVFFDAGRTWGPAPLAAPNLGLLKDAGFGLRFGNARSGLGNVIHVDVAFPFDGDNSIKRVQFLVQTKQSF
jgi:hemolysin activation/secretion protein